MRVSLPSPDTPSLDLVGLGGERETLLPFKVAMKDSLFCAALITSPHGIQGHVKVKCFLENPRDLLTYSPFSNETGEETYTVTRILSQAKEMLVLALEGVTTRTQAEGLKNHKLMMPRSHLPDLSENTFYHADLLGLKVLAPDNMCIGTVRALYNFGAGDLIEIETKTGKCEVLPFSHLIVPEIELPKGFVKLSLEAIHLIEGQSHDT